MKKLYTLVSAVLLTTSLWAQAPQKMSYQAVVRGANNALVVEKSVSIRISILKGSETGSTVYSETHTPRTNTNGLASLSIGTGKNPSSDFSKIDWSKGPYFVKTEMDVNGGTNYQLTAVSELMSVPYALHASNSDESGNGIKSVSHTGDTLYLNNGKFVIIPGISLAQPKPTSGYGPNITDNDGNTYKTVYIGTQQWMAENLKTSKYNDGTVIPNVTDATQWLDLTTGAWAYYNNDASNNAKYGKLYNWYAVSPTTNGNKNVCPTGWHLPTKTEWGKLSYFLGINAVSKMKEVGTSSWDSPNTDATNSSLFTGLPGGIRSNTGDFGGIGWMGAWWSTTEESNYQATSFTLSSTNSNVVIIGDSKINGLSVRCIKD
jgi:uncharacterized protein (TIGR02145 family)